jgi:hypothetical protein
LPETTTFGRRHSASATPAAAAPRSTSAAQAIDALSPEAEAFRARLALDKSQAKSGSSARRSSRRRQVLVWGATLASFAPGVATFLMDAPLEVSIGLEIVAMVANVWIRRERRRRLKEIVAWEDPADTG